MPLLRRRPEGGRFKNRGVDRSGLGQQAGKGKIVIPLCLPAPLDAAVTVDTAFLFQNPGRDGLLVFFQHAGFHQVKYGGNPVFILGMAAGELILVAAVFAAMIWVLVDYGVLTLQDSQANAWIGIALLSLVLGIGLSWSFVRRAISGQYDVDDADD